MSDSYVASTIKRELGWEVFEYTFNTIIGLKRAINRADKALLRTYRDHVLVVHYKDPKIFNGLVQQVIGGSHYLFYDEKTHRGGLAYAKRGGKGSRSLNKRYEFETYNVAELLAGTIGIGVDDRYCESFGYLDSFDRHRAEGLDGARLSMLTIDKINTEDNGEVKVCRAFLRGPRKEVTYALVKKDNRAIRVNHRALFDQAIRIATTNDKPLERYRIMPIIGTEFILAKRKLPYEYGDGILIYIGRKHLSREVLEKKIKKALEY